MQYAGEYNILECKLITTSGTEFDLFNIVSDIVILLLKQIISIHTFNIVFSNFVKLKDVR